MPSPPATIPRNRPAARLTAIATASCFRRGGVVVLEEYEHAPTRCDDSRRSPRLWDVVRRQPHDRSGPNGLGCRRAMAAAIRDAKINPANIEYVNAMALALRSVIRPKRRPSSVFSKSMRRNSVCPAPKSQLGHLLGASGGVEFVVSILSLMHQVAPPTINIENQDPECESGLHSQRSSAPEDQQSADQQLWFRRTQCVPRRGKSRLISDIGGQK